MEAAAILIRARELGIMLEADGEAIVARPRGATPPDLAAAIRQCKADLIAHLRAGTGSRREHTMTPDSRHPLIDPAIRAKLEAVEAEARAAGWPAELLWNAGFWDRPRGLAAVLDPDDEIVEVAPDYIAILKTKRDLLRFRRHTA
jgi:hypothetical protein